MASMRDQSYWIMALFLVARVRGFCKPSHLGSDYELRFGNTARLYEGASTLQQLSEASVCVIGLGGVGSWVVEALSRSGIGHLCLIDFDDVCVSNTNRQLPALTSTAGKFKAEVLRDRVLDINPDASVDMIIDYCRPSNVDDLLTKSVEGIRQRKFDYVVDAADGVSDKAAIIDSCVRSGTPVVVSGGVGGLLDPTLITVSDLSLVTGDNLLMRVRKKLRQKNGYPQGEQMSGGRRNKMKRWGVRCVHTLPTGKKRTKRGNEEEGGACNVYGNSCFSTGTAGFVMASEVVNNLMQASNEKNRPSSALPGANTAASGSGDAATLGSGGTALKPPQGGMSGSAEGSGETEHEYFDWGAGESTDGLTGVALFDAHCHLNLSPLFERADDAVQNARLRGLVGASVCSVAPGSDWERVESLSKAYPGWVRPHFGLHPWWLSRYAQTRGAMALGDEETCQDCGEEAAFDPYAGLREKLVEVLTNNAYAGVGEVGLDKSISKEVDMAAQKAVLKMHLDVAQELSRPVTLHCVGAWGSLLEVLYGMHRLPPGVVLHASNSMPSEMLNQFLSLSCVYLSFTGGKSLNTSKTRHLLRGVPLNRLLVETDSPDQLPFDLKSELPHNEMAVLRRSIVGVAETLGMEATSVAEQVYKNAQIVFSL